MGNSITKRCPKCRDDLPLDAFAPSQRSRPNVYCILCQRVYNREYYAANKERLDVVNRAYAQRHTEELRVYRQQYRAEHLDLYENRKPYYGQRYQANKEEIRAHQREYQRQHPEYSARRTMRYYARKKGAEGNHTAAEWIALREWFGNRCLCCGTVGKVEADHVIPLDRGGSDDIANIQSLCRSCNASKGTQTTDYRDLDLLAVFLDTL